MNTFIYIWEIDRHPDKKIDICIHVCIYVCIHREVRDCKCSKVVCKGKPVLSCGYTHSRERCWLVSPKKKILLLPKAVCDCLQQSPGMVLKPCLLAFTFPVNNFSDVVSRGLLHGWKSVPSIAAWSGFVHWGNSCLETVPETSSSAQLRRLLKRINS